jgi:hypothetical protein
MWLLSPSSPNRVGRAIDVEVRLQAPLLSRVAFVVTQEPGRGWSARPVETASLVVRRGADAVTPRADGSIVLRTADLMIADGLAFVFVDAGDRPIAAPEQAAPPPDAGAGAAEAPPKAAAAPPLRAPARGASSSGRREPRRCASASRGRSRRSSGTSCCPPWPEGDVLRLDGTVDERSATTLSSDPTAGNRLRGAASR